VVSCYKVSNTQIIQYILTKNFRNTMRQNKYTQLTSFEKSVTIFPPLLVSALSDRFILGNVSNGMFASILITRPYTRGIFLQEYKTNKCYSISISSWCPCTDAARCVENNARSSETQHLIWTWVLYLKHTRFIPTTQS
jgi:hypothetical protein